MEEGEQFLALITCVTDGGSDRESARVHACTHTHAQSLQKAV